MLATTLSICALAIALISSNVAHNTKLDNQKAKLTDELHAIQKSIKESSESSTRDQWFSHDQAELGLRLAHLSIEHSHYDSDIGFGSIIIFLGALQIFFLYDPRNKMTD